MVSLRDTLASRGLTDSKTNRTSESALPWSEAERQASLSLHLGDPATARRIWTEAINPSSRGIRQARIGDTWLASLEFGRAAGSYQYSLELEPALSSAWFGLALTRMLQARPTETLEACRAGLKVNPTTPQRESLKAFEEIVSEAILAKQIPQTTDFKPTF
jgi:tetratricopeptide (TPR) repeat protein